MCDCASSSLSHYSCTIKLQIPSSTNHLYIQKNTNNLVSFGSYASKNQSSCSIKVGRNSSAASSESDEQKSYTELGFKEIGLFGQNEKADFLEFDDNEKDFVKIRGSESGVGLKLEELDKSEARMGRRQVMKRSNLVAKQVISMQSALSLGFVSQLWVDAKSWLVVVVEVRPNLLSGELERFLLEDVSQVGDVVLIQDESVTENAFKMIGLETLVGYNVVTPSGRLIGKVRGYSFNINSGAIESLELDSFGISIIPSSLVSTYALFVEDVVEVVADIVVVHEAAASHIQRVTKGFWDGQRPDYSMDELDGYSGLEREPTRPDNRKGRQKRSSGQKYRTKQRENTDEDDWELPMDYL